MSRSLNLRPCVKHLNSIATRRCYASFKQRQTLPQVVQIKSSLQEVDIDDFRQTAFIPTVPALISSREVRQDTNAKGFTPRNPIDMVFPTLPWAQRWFERKSTPETPRGKNLPSLKYLEPYADTILPYEFSTGSEGFNVKIDDPVAQELHDLIRTLVGGSKDSSPNTFYRFNAPLELYLKVSQVKEPERRYLRQLYIAQAQVSSLPKNMQRDLPTPRLVLEAGKGDIYDTNIWLGFRSSTPLHKDPNPNLFVQLASRKHVKIFPPEVGSAIFREVQKEFGGNDLESIRTEEMMRRGPGTQSAFLQQELEKQTDGLETDLYPGDALFIPKGWWHAVYCVSKEANMSVNWWFR